MANKPHVTIYTDGACSGNPGPGGWGALLQFGNHEKELSGSAKETTNNRMEITAAVMAFRALKEPCQVNIYTDSEYLKKGITDWIHNWKKLGWRRGSSGKTKPLANADLWKELDQAITDHQVSWHWVRGHAGHTENERVDNLAVSAMKNR
ncbi:MAG: ribonuclease HI [Chloroflexota bacterium]|nr:MAG: ribonuclease HI [Chloroflexota bacterium]